MPHGHHEGGQHHHGGYQHRYDHRWHMEEGWIGWPLLAGLLGVFLRSREYDRPRHNRGGGCSIFALMFSIIIVVAIIRFWWLVVPITILAVIGMVFLARWLRGKSRGPRTNYQQFNQPHQAGQPYQQGYSAPPPDSRSYQEGYAASAPESQPYAPQSGWGQYEMPEAQYPQTMPPMQ